MTGPIRWTVQDRFGNSIYLTQERWEHIIEPINHPEIEDYEEELKETVKTGSRKQDSLNPQKFRYSKKFDDLSASNTHIVAIVSRSQKNQKQPENRGTGVRLYPCFQGTS